MSLFVRRRFFEFRQGHSIYGVLPISFVNFILIFYSQFLAPVFAFPQIFENISIFALLFGTGYIAMMTLVGRWHIRTQMPTDQQMQVNVHRFFQGLKTQLDRIENKIEELKRIDAHA